MPRYPPLPAVHLPLLREISVAAVDVDTGELGRLTGDMPETCTVWHDTHPVTGAAVRGRVLPHWPAVCALALAGHRGFCDRVVVGWDIAITPDGPQIVEGNPNPDVLLIRCVHGAPIGRRPLGALRWLAPSATPARPPSMPRRCRTIQPTAR
ncbi:sugar-transfer associated ATP-grasp domain-containing protein [Immundisolibacter sp.]